MWICIILQWVRGGVTQKHVIVGIFFHWCKIDNPVAQGGHPNLTLSQGGGAQWASTYPLLAPEALKTPQVLPALYAFFPA